MKKISFEGTYKYDYDIETIDQHILEALKWEKNNYGCILNKKIKKQKRKLNNKNLKKIEISSIEKKIQSLKDFKNKIESGKRLNEYSNQVDNLFKKFPCKIKKKGTFNFGEENNFYNDNKNSDEIKKRLYVIEEFLKIASRYVNINIKREIEFDNNNLCFYCSQDLTFGNKIDNTYIICSNCQSRNPIAKNNKKKNIKEHNNREDDSIDNFIRVMDRYEGKIIKKIPDIIYKELDKYFISCGRPTGQQVKKMEKRNRFRGDTNHKMLRNALNAIGASNYYNHIEYIGKNYWGWELPNISNYKDKIMIHYKATQKVYNEIPSNIRGRESSLGTQFRLWKHLQLVGYNCSRNEFNIPENKDSLSRHQKLWKYMCDNCELDDVYYIND